LVGVEAAYEKYTEVPSSGGVASNVGTWHGPLHKVPADFSAHPSALKIHCPRPFN
jgi:hypothetical protein